MTIKTYLVSTAAVDAVKNILRNNAFQRNEVLERHFPQVK